MVEKVCRVLSTLLLVVLLVLAVVLVGPPLLGMKTMAVLSGSMEPAFSAGDMVIVKPVEPQAVQVGDMITFSMEGSQMVATHRVTEIRPDVQAFVTKGDANQADDGEIAYDRLVGKVVTVIPKLGAFTALLKGREGILMAAGLLVVLILLTALPIIFKKPPQEKSSE